MDGFVERKVGEVTVRIDRTTCIASGNCIKLAPELFELDAEHIVAFKGGPVEIGQDRAIEACRVCPVDALIVLDAAGKQVVS